MKVALLSPFKAAIREPFSGGTHAFIHRLSVDLVGRGHDVVCYAPEGSEIPGAEVRSLGFLPSSVSLDPYQPNADLDASISAARQEQAIRQCWIEIASDESIDIVHNNSFSPTPLLCRVGPRTAVVHTMHAPFGAIKDLVYALGKVRHIIADAVVAVSNSQAGWWRRIYPETTAIWNGVPVSSLPSPCEHDGSLAFAGRIAPEKGLEDSVQVARRLGMRLDVFGPVDALHRDYFRQRIEPLMGDGVSYGGWLRQDELYLRLRAAQALLMPTRWAEPFGYAAVEAMCLGVPVVAYSRGAMPELVRAAGFGEIVAAGAVDELATAAALVADVDHRELAARAREVFSQDRSTDLYLETYDKALKKKRDGVRV